MLKTRGRLARVGLVTLILGALAGCSHDPQLDALRQGVELMKSIVQSPVLLEAVRDNDPEMKPSAAAVLAISGQVTANFPTPPHGISVQNPALPSAPWSVRVVGDDEKKKVRIEGFADNLSQPALVEEIDFPPQ